MLSSAGSIGRSNAHPYTIFHKLDGDVCVIHCSTIGVIDHFMMSWCSSPMTQTEKKLFDDFVKYSDGDIVERPELKALDDMLVAMVSSTLGCAEIQRGYCA